MHIFPQRLKLVTYLLPTLLLLQRVSSITDQGQLGTSDQVSMHSILSTWTKIGAEPLLTEQLEHAAKCQHHPSLHQYTHFFLKPSQWTHSGCKWFIEIIQVEDLAKFSKSKCCLIQHLRRVALSSANEVTLSSLLSFCLNYLSRSSRQAMFPSSFSLPNEIQFWFRLLRCSVFSYRYSSHSLPGGTSSAHTRRWIQVPRWRLTLVNDYLQLKIHLQNFLCMWSQMYPSFPESLVEDGSSQYPQLGLSVLWMCQCWWVRCRASNSTLRDRNGARPRSPPSSVQRPHIFNCRRCVSQPQLQRLTPELSLYVWLMFLALEDFNSIPGVLTTGHHQHYMQNGYINLVTTYEGRTESLLSNESQSWRFEHGDWKEN